MFYCGSILEARHERFRGALAIISRTSQPREGSDLLERRAQTHSETHLTTEPAVVPGGLFEDTRPEDKIFALHGICKRLGYELPALVYQKPPAVVYTEAAKAILRYDQSLELLSVATESSAWADGLPSWVPNFSGCMSRWSPSSPPQLTAVATRESLKTLGLTQCQYLLEPNDTGLKQGERPPIGHAANQMQYADSLIDCIGSWLAVVMSRTDSLSGMAAIGHMARVLTNNVGDKYPPVPFEDMVRYLAVLVTMSASENPMRFAILASLPNGSLSPGQEEIIGLMAGCYLAITRIFGSIWQTMFRTDSGYIGMGPYSLTASDIVVLLQGYATAGVIRPSTGGFRYVGPAFVNGIMDTEFWNPGSDNEWFVLV
ncbi:hypothetical protein B0O99DRAFT_749066 [Bisporella sp. PMI_857]|nr:hypothetical protein B0O99DRAFT_749066 [Bisporella sp. PMI_857]